MDTCSLCCVLCVVCRLQCCPVPFLLRCYLCFHELEQQLLTMWSSSLLPCVSLFQYLPSSFTVTLSRGLQTTFTPTQWRYRLYVLHCGKSLWSAHCHSRSSCLLNSDEDALLNYYCCCCCCGYSCSTTTTTTIYYYYCLNTINSLFSRDPCKLSWVPWKSAKEEPLGIEYWRIFHTPLYIPMNCVKTLSKIDR